MESSSSEQTNQSNTNTTKNKQQQESTSSINIQLFDLETYISRYEPKSETRLQRLLFIARHAPSNDSHTDDDDLATAAYGTLEKQLKENENWRKYKEIFGGCCRRTEGGDLRMDTTAVGAMSLRENGGDGGGEEGKEGDMNETTNKPSTLHFTYLPTLSTQYSSNSALTLSTLESNFLSAQSCLDKDRIRQALLALGSHHRLTGNIEEASRRYKAAKTYCLNNGQAMENCMVVLSCALDAREYGKVRELVGRAEQQGTGGGDGGGMVADWFGSHLQCALGLAYLAEGQFSDAAVAFGRVRVVDTTPTNQLSAMLSLEDLALYGGLLGLATMDRETMSKSLDVESCRERLELIPPLRDAIRHYVRAEYGACLNLLEELRGGWGLDMYLARHADGLWRMVRDKCIIQYFAPYTSVSLETMMESFGFFDSLEEVEEVVANLIERKKIVGARIHGVNKTLSSMSVRGLERRERRAMMRKVGRMGDVLLREVEGTVLRLACLENNICVTEGKKGKKGGRKMRQNRSSWRDGASAERAMLMGGESNMQEGSSDSSDDDDFYASRNENTTPSMMDIDDFTKAMM